MTRIDVDPEALAGAGRAISELGDQFAAAVSALSSSLEGGAPTGLDAAGAAFGLAYQKSAHALMDAGSALVNGSRNIGFGIGMSATNYSHAEAASTVGGGAAPLTAPEKPVDVDAPPCPPSLGGGAPPPFLWTVLQTFIPNTWPDGDAGRVQASAAAWQTFASAIKAAADEMSASSLTISAQQIPEAGAITTAVSRLATSITDTAGEADKLATQTREFADDVRSTQDAIRDLCDRISPSGFFDGITAIFSGDALDEIKQIANDVKQVLENFGRQVDGRISLMQALITAIDDAVVTLQQHARREFTHYLGEDVGGALASAFEFQSNLSEGVLTAGLESIVDIQRLDPLRFASDPEGAAAAWGGVLDTLKYANPSTAALDPIGAFEHGKDVVGGILHTENWRRDRPGLGLGGVLFEVGSAATGVGAAKTGLRGATAAAEAGEAGPAVRAAAGAAESTAPIAGRASEIASQLDDLTKLADDVPGGASSGARGPSVPSSLAEADAPQVAEPPRLPEEPSSSRLEGAGAGEASSGASAPSETAGGRSDVTTGSAADAPNSPDRDAGHASSPSTVDPTPPASVSTRPSHDVENEGFLATPDRTTSPAGPGPSGLEGHSSSHLESSQADTYSEVAPSKQEAALSGVDSTPQSPAAHREAMHHSSQNPDDSTSTHHSPRHGEDGGRQPESPIGEAAEPAHSHSGQREDSVHSDAQSGDGWHRLDDGPLDPHYGQPLSEHWESGQYPERTESNSRTFDLVEHPWEPYGHSERGVPLTKEQYDSRYNVLGDQGQHYNNYPPNDGAVPGSRVMYDDVSAYLRDFGNQFDRIGGDNGKYLGVMTDGIAPSFEMRSLPVSSLSLEYNSFRLNDLPEGWTIEVSEIAPAFGRDGGGLQVLVYDDLGDALRVKDLLENGVLERWP